MSPALIVVQSALSVYIFICPSQPVPLTDSLVVSFQMADCPATPCSHMLASIRPALRSLKRSLTGAAEEPRCYASDILTHLKASELELPADCLSKQPAISHKLRAVLVDWMLALHWKFKLAPETLFLAVALMDRYMSVETVSRQQLQLLGITVVLIASKYEDIYPPEVKEFLLAAENAYTRRQVLEMEVNVLNALEFKLTAPSAWGFLERFIQETSLTDQNRHLAEYLLELSLIEYHMLRYKASLQAAAAMLIALRAQRKETRWTTNLVAVTGWTEMQLRDCARDMLVLFQAAPKHALSAVREKYSRPQACEVAKITLM